MRHLWLRGVAVAWAALLALSMLVLNHAFEAAGSVPDVEGCGFVAGSLASLLLLYPLLAAIIARSAVVWAGCRWTLDPACAVRLGSFVALAGCGAYFGLGLLLTSRGSQISTPSALIGWLALYVLLCVAAARWGALQGLRRVQQAALRADGG